MAFSPQVRAMAYRRSRGQCECMRRRHGHGFFRCSTRLRPQSGHYHHRKAVRVGGDDSFPNCEYLCQSCHERTGSYGRR